MLRAIWLSVRRVAASLPGGLGLVSSGLGTYSGIVGHHVGIPGWGLLAAGAGLLFVKACQVEYELLLERERVRTPTVDLQALVQRLSGTDVTLPLSSMQSGYAAAIGDALDEIREKANLGLVHVFGRPGPIVTQHLRSVPLEDIPREHWTNHSIDYLDVLRDKTGVTKSAVSTSQSVGYRDLWFDRVEVSRVWPKKRRGRFAVRWPIVKVSPQR